MLMPTPVVSQGHGFRICCGQWTIAGARAEQRREQAWGGGGGGGRLREENAASPIVVRISNWDATALAAVLFAIAGSGAFIHRRETLSLRTSAGCFMP